MNIEEKTKLAHEYAVANNSYSSDAWAYADAMEVEYKKRKQAESEQNAKQSKILFEQLTKNEDGSCAHFHTTLNKAECFDCGFKLQDEFQVDWSVAPDWAVVWTADKSEFLWWNEIPCFKGAVWFAESGTWRCSAAPSFNYQGDWKDSLRKRPQ